MIGSFPPAVGTKQERKLLRLFKSLSNEDKQTIVKFARFLTDNNSDSEKADQDSPEKINERTVIPSPSSIERPAQESVIKAIKRLNKTYPMIDKSTLLDRTSGLMTEHLLKGRDAVSIIDELEEMFELAYNDLLKLD